MGRDLIRRVQVSGQMSRADDLRMSSSGATAVGVVRPLTDHRRATAQPTPVWSNLSMAPTRVTGPQGNQWIVRRKWVPRRLRWRGKRGAGDLVDGADLVSLGGDLPVVGVILAAIALLLLAIAAVMFIVPAVIFLVELLIIVVIVGLGVMGRVLFGRPWTVEAQRTDETEAFEWKVSGWRASQDLVHSVADQLRATGLPTGGTAVPT